MFSAWFLGPKSVKYFLPCTCKERLLIHGTLDVCFIVSLGDPGSETKKTLLVIKILMASRQ